jgi:hypothetical protein
MVDIASHSRGRERESERKRRRSNQPELDHGFLLVNWQIDRKIASRRFANLAKYQ